jgi:hypothetical protein
MKTTWWMRARRGAVVVAVTASEVEDVEAGCFAESDFDELPIATTHPASRSMAIAASAVTAVRMQGV